MATFPYLESRSPGGPLRPPMKGERAGQEPEKKDEQEQSSVFYRDPKTSEKIPVMHPEITGLPLRHSKILEATMPVKIQIGRKNLEIRFVDYLKMIGATYADYEAAAKHFPASRADLFRALHQQGLNARLHEAQTADHQIHESFKRHERNNVVREEMEGFLVRLINESGYGEAALGTAQNDHHDKIDFFLKLDPAKIPRQKGDPVYIGVQHTTLSEYKTSQLDQKRSMVENRQERYIPEHPEYGMVTSILHLEDRKNYFPQNGERSFDFIRKTLERKSGRKAKSWEALRFNQFGEPDGKGENEARAEARKRVYDLYKNALESVTTYAKESQPFFKQDMERKKGVITAMIAMMEKENPDLVKKTSA